MSDRVLVLLCPDWPVVAACAENPQVSFDSPVALSHAGVITDTSPVARRRGVTAGRRLRDAQATASDLVVLAHDVEREQRVWNQVLQGLRDTVARIAVIEPGTLAVRAAGLARYYGSEQRATEVLLEVLAAMDWIPAARIGIADTLFTATQAARHGTNPQRPTVIVPEGADRDVLGPLPLGVLDSPDLVGTLQALGLSTLADFAAFDSHQVSQRFGATAALLHTCAQGLDPRQAGTIDIPPSTDRIWRSDQPLSRADELSFALRATVDNFLAGLTAVYVVCTTVRITLVDDRGESHTQVWSHPRFFSAADIVNRVRWQWESLARRCVEEYHEGGVAEVHLQALSPDSLFSHEPGLWGGAEANSQVEHSIARLQSSLGHDAVARAWLQPGHDFDEREALVPWGSATPIATTSLDGQVPPASFVGEIPRPLPATVFHPPTPVELTDSLGVSLAVDCEEAALRSQPALLHSGQATRNVVAWAGPWPVIERWWDQQASRRRYRLQLLDQEGVGWLVSQDPTIGQWQVEARYD